MRAAYRGRARDQKEARRVADDHADLRGQYGLHVRFHSDRRTVGGPNAHRRAGRYGRWVLGAGAILQHRGTIIGLTTGATIWTAAAIGVLVGGGYGAAGLVLTLLVVGLLIVEQRIEDWMLGSCRHTNVQVAYHPDYGKTRVRLLRVLDDFRIPDSAWEVSTEGELEVADIQYCHFHQQHRAILLEIVNLPGIVELRRLRTQRQVGSPATPER